MSDIVSVSVNLIAGFLALDVDDFVFVIAFGICDDINWPLLPSFSPVSSFSHSSWPLTAPRLKIHFVALFTPARSPESNFIIWQLISTPF